MSDTEPTRSRIIVEKGIEDLKITIPSKRNAGLVVFLGFWLCGWAIGEVMVGYSLVAGLLNTGPAPVKGMTGAGAAFALFWLCGWTVGGAAALYAWLWNIHGREIITVNIESLTVARVIPGWSSQKEYRMPDVANVRSAGAALFPRAAGADRTLLRRGRVLFDYEESVKAFGKELSEEEAGEIVDEIARMFPQKVAAKRSDAGQADYVIDSLAEGGEAGQGSDTSDNSLEES
jgi:hypothetical protein